MTHTVPSAKQMEDSRQTHYFRDADDNRLAVVTEFRPGYEYGAGEYVAWVEGEEDGLNGVGYTMMEAIADLAALIEENA